MQSYEHSLIVMSSALFPPSKVCFRKVQANGLQQKYIDNEQFNLVIKMTSALVPENAVDETFYSMTEHISANVQHILDYSEDSFIVRPGRRT